MLIIYVMEPRHLTLVTPEYAPPTPEVDAPHLGRVPESGRVMTGEEFTKFSTDFEGALERIESGHVTAGRISENETARNPRIAATYGTSIPGYAEKRAAYEKQLSDLAELNAAAGEEELKNVIRDGDTTTALDWLADVVSASLTDATAREARVEDALDSYQTASSSAKSSRAELKRTRRTHRANPIRMPAPLATDATDEQRVAHKAQEDAQKAAQQARDKDVGTRSILDAREKFAADNASREVLLASTLERRHAGFDSRLTSVYEEVAQEQAAKLERIEELDLQISDALELWDFRLPAPNENTTQDIAESLSEWGQILDTMSRFDETRAVLLDLWTRQSARLHQRRALTEDPSNPNTPRFTPDRGITIQTDSGPQTLYDDGSIVRQEGDGGHPVRRLADGTLWGGEHIEAPDFSRFRHLGVGELYSAVRDAMTEWDFERTPDYEIIVAAAIRAYSERLDTTTLRSRENLQVKEDIVHGAEAIFQAARSTRNTDIASLVSELEDPSDTNAVHNVTRFVDGIIDSLRETLDEAIFERENSRNILRHAQTDSNMALYWRGFFGVTHPEVSFEADTDPLQIIPNGEIFLEGQIVNNIRGNWAIRLDGSARLSLPDGTIEQYAPNGERIA